MRGYIIMIVISAAVMLTGIYLVAGGSLYSMTFVVAGGMFLALGIRQYITAKNNSGKKGADDAR